MTESASSTSGQEFDVFSVMDWKDGVGTLPGSDLKVSYLYYVQFYVIVKIKAEHVHKLRVKNSKHHAYVLHGT